ncbi:MAG: RICIN domain-containing protein [Anaerolineales bacterium]|nr:RICIN domain-containing protein [Anaerolineales bacterium]
MSKLNKQLIVHLLVLLAFISSLVGTAVPAAHAQIPAQRLQFRILEVAALDETDPEWPGNDDISLAFTYASRSGVVKVPFRRVGTFSDGTVQRYYNQPWVAAEIPLNHMPDMLQVSLLLVEEDGGGKERVLDEYYGYQQMPFMRSQQALQTTEKASVEEQAAQIAVEALKKLAQELADVALKKVGNYLVGGADDFFPVQTVNKLITSPQQRFNGATFERGEMVIRGHGGRYRIVYDWKLVVSNGLRIYLQPAHALASCVDVPWEDWPHNGTKLQLWKCLGSMQTNQQWYLAPVGNYYQLVSDMTGKCLDVPAQAQYRNGTAVQQWDCYGAKQLNQLWQLKRVGDYYQLVSVVSGKCLDVAAEGWDKDRTKIQQWDCYGVKQLNQLWRLQPVE